MHIELRGCFVHVGIMCEAVSFHHSLLCVKVDVFDVDIELNGLDAKALYCDSYSHLLVFASYYYRERVSILFQFVV